jgi:hypothetical protein
MYMSTLSGFVSPCIATFKRVQQEYDNKLNKIDKAIKKFKKIKEGEVSKLSEAEVQQEIIKQKKKQLSELESIKPTVEQERMEIYRLMQNLTVNFIFVVSYKNTFWFVNCKKNIRRLKKNE